MEHRPAKYEPVVVLLDVDRCTLNTEKTFDLAVDAVVARTPIGYDQMYEAYEQTKLRGEAFNVVGWINHELGRRATGLTWQRDVEAYFVVNASKENLLMDGAKELLDELAESDVFTALITYGASSDRPDMLRNDAETWQRAKVRACRELAGMACYVCSDRQKGRLLASWSDDRGVWLPEELCVEGEMPIVAEKVILVDDKTDSFSGKNDRLLGVRVRPVDKLNHLPYQEGKLPDGVVAVEGMHAATETIRKMLVDF